MANDLMTLEESFMLNRTVGVEDNPNLLRLSSCAIGAVRLLLYDR